MDNNWIRLNRLVTKRNSTITKTMLKHHWRTVEYMYARGKGYARGALQNSVAVVEDQLAKWCRRRWVVTCITIPR